MAVPRVIDYDEELFTNAVVDLLHNEGEGEGKLILERISVEIEKLYDLDWLNLPENISAEPGQRRYVVAVSPIYSFTFRRETKRKAYKPIEEWIWIETIFTK